MSHHITYINYSIKLALATEAQVPAYILDVVTSSGILKAKQKLGRTFNSDKLGGIALTKISKLTMCSAQEEAQAIAPASTGTAHAQF